MEGYYSAHTAKCWACTARESEAADQHGKGVLIGVVDDSYTDGYEPRSPGRPQQPDHGKREPEERHQPPDGR